MAPYRLTERARLGLDDIIEFVQTTFGDTVALQVLDRIEDAFELLESNPAVGHVREDLTDDERVRFWPVPPSLVAYRVGAKGLEILFVERGARDWTRVLEAIPEEDDGAPERPE